MLVPFLKFGLWAKSALVVTGLMVLLLFSGNTFLSHAKAYEEDELLLLDVPSSVVKAIDFSSEGRKGNALKLSDFKGKVVFLNFWATWCIPCLMEMPAMERLHQAMQGQPFVILAVSQGDSRKKVNAYAEKYNLSFEMVMDESGDIGATYRADNLPLTYIISPGGTIARRAIGPREWDSEAAIRLFKKLIVEAKAAGHSKASPSALK